MIKSLNELYERSLKNRVRIVVPAAEDDHVIEALADVAGIFYVYIIFIGETQKIEAISKKAGLSPTAFEILESVDSTRAAQTAVEIIKKGDADILMKGNLSTKEFLKPVVSVETGIKKEKLLNHIALFESPYYHKVLGVSDAAMNIYPGIEEKKEIIRNCVNLYQNLGYSNIRIALLSALEQVNEKIVSSKEAFELTAFFKKNPIKNCIVEGPLALDNAISKEAAIHKKIKNEVAGNADLLVVPNIDSGNILYKTLNFLGNARSAAIILGATVPIVLTSRADTSETKKLSIALAINQMNDSK